MNVVDVTLSSYCSIHHVLSYRRLVGILAFVDNLFTDILTYSLKC